MKTITKAQLDKMVASGLLQTATAILMMGSHNKGRK